MKTKLFKSCLFAIIAIAFSSCLDDQANKDKIYYTDQEYEVLTNALNIPDEPLNYKETLPNHYTNSGINVSMPNISNSKATLGRVLFYDNELSQNKAVSCASCHIQERAFGDPIAKSKGFEGEFTVRNSFALGAVLNPIPTYYGSFSSIVPGILFWDNSVNTVAEQINQTLSNPIEMGMNMPELINRLKQQEHYRILFEKAYHQEGITEFMVTDALEQFMHSMSSFHSKFDEGLEAIGELNTTTDFPNFTTKENLGKQLYNNNCSSCHGSNQIRTTVVVANNGLEMVYEDKGVGLIENNSNLYGVFKVPLLRNVELTAPYMHDGSLETLEDVLDHYSEGIIRHPNLDNLLIDQSTGEALKMNFSDEDKENIIAYLNTLTDYDFISNVKYSDPFK